MLALRSAAGAKLRGLCRVNGAHPILARRRPGRTGIHQGNDDVESHHVKGGEFRAPELALAVGQRGQYAGEQAGLRKRRAARRVCTLTFIARR